MNSPWMRLLSASFVIAICTFSTAAQSQGSANASCPPAYWLMEALCFDDAMGDVAKAAPVAVGPLPVKPGFAPGHRQPDRLRLDAVTGDVERVDEKTWPASAKSRH